MNSFSGSILQRFCKCAAEVPASEDDSEWSLESALNILRRADPDLNSRIRGKAILDFGSGMGYQSAALLRAGAARVVGIEIRRDQQASARRLLEKHGLSALGDFFSSAEELRDEKFDLVISQDAMEHYSEPEKALGQMHARLKPGGTLLITFGPPWYAPYGAHMQFFTKIPWVHLLFSERTIMDGPGEVPARRSKTLPRSAGWAQSDVDTALRKTRGRSGVDTKIPQIRMRARHELLRFYSRAARVLHQPRHGIAHP